MILYNKVYIHIPIMNTTVSAELRELRERVVKYATCGDVNAILDLQLMPSSNMFLIMAYTAAEQGHVGVLRQCIQPDIWEKNPGFCHAVFRSALNAGKCEVLEFLRVYHRSHACFRDAQMVMMCAVWNNHLSVVQWWMTKGWDGDSDAEKRAFSRGVFFHAIRCGVHEIVLWLLERGVRYDVTEDFEDWVSKRRRLQTLYVLHEFKVNIASCKTSSCVLCKRESLWNTWIMESSDFTDSIQWLPREMVVDVVRLCVESS